MVDRGRGGLRSLLVQQRSLLRGTRRRQLALGLRRFALRPPARGPAAAGRLVSPFGPLFRPFLAPPLRLFLAAFAVFQPCGALLFAGKLALLLRARRRSGGGRRRGSLSPRRGLLRRGRWWSGRPSLLLGLALAAPLADANREQEQEDRDGEPGDEVLDVVADEVAHFAGEGVCNRDQRGNPVTHRAEATSFCS